MAEGLAVTGVSLPLCMKLSRSVTTAWGRPIIALEYCCRAVPELLGIVIMARGCLLLEEEEEEGRGGRREEVQARSRSGAVVMMGPYVRKHHLMASLTVL